MPKPKKHKRKGPKSTRAGCLMCKPQKRQGVDDPQRQERRARVDEAQQREESPYIKGRIAW